MKRVLYLFLILNVTYASTPKEIMYQGLLTDSKGVPFADGSYSVSFSLYDVATAGAPLWTQAQTITINNGIFSTALGSDTGISLNFDKPYWLGIVYNAKELGSRIKLSSSAYSFRAMISDSAVIARSTMFADSSLKAAHSSNADYATNAGRVSANSHVHSWMSKKGKNDTAVVVDTNGNVGIGRNILLTTNGIFSGSNVQSNLLLQSTGDFHARGLTTAGGIPKFRATGIGLQSYFVGDRVNGTFSTPTALLKDDLIVSFLGLGYHGIGNTGTHCAEMKYLSNENWTSTSRGSRIELWNNNNGESIQRLALKIGGTGKQDVEAPNGAFISSNARISLWPYNGAFAMFGNQNLIGSQESYALLQQDDGNTYLNAAPQKSISLGIGNRGNVLIDSSGVSIGNTFRSEIRKLNVNGDVMIGGETTGTELFLRGLSGTTFNYIISSKKLSRLSIYSENKINEPFSIDNDNNVAIRDTTTHGYNFFVNGKAYLTGNLYASNFPSSDSRLKTSIDSIPNTLNKIDSIQGVTYFWDKAKYPNRNFPDGKQIGVIAQDVEKVFPELVHTDAEGYKSVSYEKLSAVLIEAVKKQKKIIENQSAKIDLLESKNNNQDQIISELIKRIEAVENR
jgi:hypothetical protein